MSDTVVSNMGVPQGTVDPFLFTISTSDINHNMGSCHLQKFSDDTTIVGCISDGNEGEYKRVISDFVDCQQNCFHLNASKTKGLLQEKTPNFVY